MCAVTIRPDSATTHPLEPLTAEEIEAAAAILREGRGMGDEARFVFIGLHEPAKDMVRGWSPGTPVPREAHIVLRDRSDRSTNEAIVSITDGKVLSYERIDGMQAPITFEEFMATEDLVRADPRWQEAMRKRGVEDFAMCMLDP